MFLGWGVPRVVECLPSMGKVLTSSSKMARERERCSCIRVALEGSHETASQSSICPWVQQRSWVHALILQELIGMVRPVDDSTPPPFVTPG
jgi:hypothetical protein